MDNKQNAKFININLIVDYFIYKAKQGKQKITNKKLQKLLYYAQAWYLVFEHKPLFKNKIEAWVHGPTIKEVYDQFKHYGFNNISKIVDTKNLEKIPNVVKKILDEVWNVYGKYDGDYLELLTHNEEPWQEARGNLESFEPSGNKILLSTMKKFYSNKLKKTIEKSK